MGCLPCKMCDECVCCNKTKNYQPWKTIENKIFDGRSIWLTPQETRKFITELGTDHSINFYPSRGVLAIVYHDQYYKYYKTTDKIPYIDYPIPVAHTIYSIPRNLRVAVPELHSEKILKLWIEEEKSKTSLVNSTFGKDISGIVTSYE